MKRIHIKRSGAKNLLNIMVCAALAAALIPVVPVHADDVDYSDTDYWNNRCQMSNIKTADDYNACQAYTQYIAASTPQLQQELDSINADRAQIATDLESYQSTISDLQTRIDQKTADIDQLEVEKAAIVTQIAETQEKIDAKQKEIDDTQAVIDAMKEKLKQRMVNGQKSLRINNMIDIFMGAKSFDDLIRIAAGLKNITEKEQDENNQLVAAMNVLNAAKTALKEAQDLLVVQEADLQAKEDVIQADKQTLVVEQYQYQVYVEAAHTRQAQLEASANNYSSKISEIQSTMSSISSSLSILQSQIFNTNPDTPSDETGGGGSPTADGWLRPVSGGYRSAGTWNYPDGGVHLGYDFAVSVGTEVRAVGSGVILLSVSGCPYGYLGSTCGGPAGQYGGGNQVHLLTVIKGSLYAVTYFHLSNGTPLATGTIVNAGDVIGLSGSSGNSSGPHVHVAIFYLGNGSNFTSYAENWNGDVAFGTYSGSYAWSTYGRRCEDGVDAPCRIRPEIIFGY